MVIKKRIKNILIYLIIITSIIGSLPLESSAHTAYFMQILVDKDNYKYISNVLEDNRSALKTENGHAENKLGNFTDIKKHGTSYDKYDTELKDKARMFTFSPMEIAEEGKEDKWFFKGAMQSGTADIDRAMEISSELVSNANQILYIVNNGETFTSMDSFIAVSNGIINASSGPKTIGKGWIIKTINEKVDGRATSMIQISKGKEVYKFKSEMIKGYTNKFYEDGRPSKVYNKGFIGVDGLNDTVTLQSLMIQGNYAYKIKGLTADSENVYAKPSPMSEKISELIDSIAIGIRNVLGLYSIEEMVYNTGARDGRLFSGGLMNKQWMNNTMAFHLIFQALAWMFLIVAMVKILFQQNLATLSVNKKINAMQGMKDLLITGFLLITIPLLVGTASMLNEKLVGVFQTTVPEFNQFGNVSGAKGIGGAIMTLYYVLISIYLNFIYIVRSITLAVLIATAPLFIVSLAFQTSEKKIFNSWMKEFIGNLFMQSIHAFVISFIISAQMGARGIEIAVTAFALILITNLVKGMIVGQSGGLMGEVAGSMTKAASGVGMGAFMATSAAKRGAQTKGGGSSRVGATGQEGNRLSSDNIPDIGANRERENHTTKIPRNSSASFENTMKDSSFKNSDNTENRAFDKSEHMAEVPFKNSGTMNKEIAKESAIGAAKTVGKGVASGALIGAGAAITMASAATGGKGIMGATLMGKGIAGVGSVGKDAILGAKNLATSGANAYAKSTTRVQDGGNILENRRMDNGDYQVTRDKTLMQKDGFIDVAKMPDGNFNMTYDTEKLGKKDLSNLENLENKFKSKEHRQELQNKGIEGIQKLNNGHYQVQYNQAGIENLGYKDIYATKNRVVETKSNKHELGSKITYGLDEVKEVPFQSYQKGGK